MIPLTQFTYAGRSPGSSLSEPTFVVASAGASHGTIAPSGTASPSYPSGVVSGSYVICVFYGKDSGTAPAAPSTPSGWSHIRTQTGVVVEGCFVFGRVCTGSEGATETFTFPSGLDTGCWSRMFRYSNGSGAEAIGGALSTPSASTISAIAVTTLGTLRRAIQVFAANTNTTMTNISGETGTDYTEEVAEYAATGVMLSVQGGSVPTATAISGGTGTLGVACTNRIAIGFAITP